MFRTTDAVLLAVPLALLAPGCSGKSEPTGRLIKGPTNSGVLQPVVDANSAKAQGIIEKAISAHGSREGLEKLDAARVVYRIKGTMPLLGEMDIKVEDIFQLPDRFRKTTKGKAGGQESELVWAIDGEACWYRLGNDEVKKLTPTNPKSAPDSRHAAGAAADRQFHPFKVLQNMQWVSAEETQLSILAEMEAGEKILVGVRVRAKDGRYSDFYFDREQGLLRRVRVLRSIAGFGLSLSAKPELAREFMVEQVFYDYKDVDGLKLPMRIDTYHDKLSTIDFVVEEVQLLKEVDAELFKKP